MTEQQVPLGSRLGSYVVHALGCYDRWIGSDADDNAFGVFQGAIEEMRAHVGHMLDSEVSR